MMEFSREVVSIYSG